MTLQRVVHRRGQHRRAGNNAVPLPRSVNTVKRPCNELPFDNIFLLDEFLYNNNNVFCRPLRQRVTWKFLRTKILRGPPLPPPTPPPHDHHISATVVCPVRINHMQYILYYAKSSSLRTYYRLSVYNIIS